MTEQNNAENLIEEIMKDVRLHGSDSDTGRALLKQIKTIKNIFQL